MKKPLTLNPFLNLFCVNRQVAINTCVRNRDEKKHTKPNKSDFNIVKITNSYDEKNVRYKCGGM